MVSDYIKNRYFNKLDTKFDKKKLPFISEAFIIEADKSMNRAFYDKSIDFCTSLGGTPRNIFEQRAIIDFAHSNNGRLFKLA